MSSIRQQAPVWAGLKEEAGSHHPEPPWLVDVVRRTCDRYGTPFDQVHSQAVTVYLTLADAPVRTFLPVLIERQLRALVRQPRDAQRAPEQSDEQPTTSSSDPTR